MTHYFKEYQNAEVVKCQTKFAVGFTVGKEYQVEETRTRRFKTQSADKFRGYKDEYVKFTDIYMINDNGDYVNASEPTDFEIVN